MTRQLSNVSDEANEVQNTTGQFDPILEIQPDRGLALVILGMVNSGDEVGIPIYADLRDSNDDPLPVDSGLRLEFEAKSDDSRTVISHGFENILNYINRGIAEQQNEEYVDSVKHKLKNSDAALANNRIPQVEITHTDTLYVTVKSDTEVDWTNSRIYFDRNAVREV